VTFIWPPLLATIALVPLGILAHRAIGARRRRRAGALGQAVDAATAGERRDIRSTVLAVLFVAAFAILAVALARPQASLPLPRAEGTVMLAFDVSASMAADDVQASRMEAAKAAARSFIAGQPSGVVIGVSAFSDAGLTVQPPSRDPSAILAAIDRLSPTRGTSLGQGILAALDAIETAEADVPAEYYSNRSPEPSPSPAIVVPGSHGSAVIVVLSDGENNAPPDPVAAAQAVADRGIRIVSVGVGSAAGTTIDLEGFEVHTALDEPLLRQVADMTAGTYLGVEEADRLGSIYADLGSRFVVRDEPIELTAFLAGAAIVLLVTGGVASLAWRGRLP
jgi:Ca-activated chloride channel family protein